MYPEQPEEQPVAPAVPEQPMNPVSTPRVEQPTYQQPTYQAQLEQPAEQLPHQPVNEQSPILQPAATPPYQPPVATHDPGKTLGIIGFIFAFVFLQIVGLPLSIIGLVKSRKAGFKNTLALVGIILNVVFLLVTIGIITAIVMVAYQGVDQRSKTTAAETAATSLVKRAEVYDAEQGTYPQHQSDITNTTASNYASAPLTSAPEDPTTVAFYACGSEIGNKVEYWDYSVNQTLSLYTGTAGASDDCTFVSN